MSTQAEMLTERDFQKKISRARNKGDYATVQRLRRERDEQVRQSYQAAIEQAVDMMREATIPIYPQAEPTPQRNEEETKAAFLSLLIDSGVQKTMTIQEKVLHEIKLGEVGEYKKTLKAEEEPGEPKKLCPICGDPLCPWSY